MVTMDLEWWVLFGKKLTSQEVITELRISYCPSKRSQTASLSASARRMSQEYQGLATQSKSHKLVIAKFASHMNGMQIDVYMISVNVSFYCKITACPSRPN